MASQIDHASFLTGGNATFVAELYGRYLTEPSNVDPSWVSFFEDLKKDGDAVAELDAAKWGRMRASVLDPNRHSENGSAGNGVSIQDRAAAVATAVNGSARRRSHRHWPGTVPASKKPSTSRRFSSS